MFDPKFTPVSGKNLIAWNILWVWDLLSTWSLMPDLYLVNQWENRAFWFLWRCFHSNGENPTEERLSLVKTAIISVPFRELWWFLSFMRSCFLRLKDDVREEVAEKGWWCLSHFSCLEQKLLLGVAVSQHPWLLWGPACGIKRWVKSCGSSARRQLWEIAQWRSAPPKIGLCRPFFSHALMTLLLTGSSNSEKLQGLFSISVLPAAPFLPCLFLPSSDVLPSEYAESKPSVWMIPLTLPFCMPAQIHIF